MENERKSTVALRAETVKRAIEVLLLDPYTRARSGVDADAEEKITGGAIMALKELGIASVEVFSLDPESTPPATFDEAVGVGAGDSLRAAALLKAACIACELLASGGASGEIRGGGARAGAVNEALRSMGFEQGNIGHE